jgi:methyl coenzyme M reductase subunit D
MISIIIAVVFLIVIAIGVFSPNDNKQLTDYDLYGMDADEYERKMIDMSEEEYKRYNKNCKEWE